MINQEVRQTDAAKVFQFNTQVPDSGNVLRDKALLKIEFEKAIDEFFESKPAIIEFQEIEE